LAEPRRLAQGLDVARVYVDLDDVLAQTVRGLLRLLECHHGQRLEEEQVRHFDLGRSFALAPAELEAFMRLAHDPEELAALEPHPDAARALGAWLAAGYDVFVMTGRPPSTEEDSRGWLQAHAIPHTRVLSVDKYGRRDWGEPAGRALPLDALEALDFALAVEDSLDMAAHLVERCAVRVALMDRPWNRDLSGLSRQAQRGIARCRDWAELLARFPAP
jgi:uncharacterized HAD superfamily protein